MLLATKVGEPTISTHARKDGTGDFTTSSTPIEFHGFAMDPATGFITIDWGTKHTLWTSDAEVIESAKESNWNDSQTGQVLVLNDKLTQLGDKGLKSVTYTLKNGPSAGETRTELQRSIWIVGDATWAFIARPISSDRGNLAQARANAGLSARPTSASSTVTVDTNVKPF